MVAEKVALVQGSRRAEFGLLEISETGHILLDEHIDNHKYK